MHVPDNQDSALHHGYASFLSHACAQGAKERARMRSTRARSERQRRSKDGNQRYDSKAYT